MTAGRTGGRSRTIPEIRSGKPAPSKAWEDVKVEETARVLLVDLAGGQALGIAAGLENAGIRVRSETTVHRLGCSLDAVRLVVVAHRSDDCSVDGVRSALREARPGLSTIFLPLSSRPSTGALLEMAGRIEAELRRSTNTDLVPLNLKPTRHLGAMIGTSRPMRDVYSAIGSVAPTSVSVLILGESGTGKELAAQAIHSHSSRREGPFVRVNCAALPASLLESELFGHQRGAFTGATHDRPGRFESANRGTLFLDEIDSAGAALQGKLLRVIEQKEFERLGDNRTRRADVRIIAATNADLPALARQGKFRADLYYRLASVELRLPPLRARGDDLLLLAADGVRRLNREVGRSVTTIRRQALDRLMTHRWPGNVRELNNVLCRCLLACDGRAIEPENLPAVLGSSCTNDATDPSNPVHDLREAISSLVAGTPDDLYRRVIDETEKQLLGLVLREHDGNIRRASQVLGIARNTLKERIRRFDLRRGEV